ncbi:MAG TPA: hypothetical protein VK689_22920 [Armatimonadota bacterium]|nr:hypothetical protein [Armatimonadota bacterium]
MKVRVPLWVALAGCLGCLVLGSVRAQMPKAEPPQPEAPTLTEYPYLPNRYGEAYIPSVADWQALRLTALGASTTRITEEFNRQHLTCFVTRKTLILTLDLVPQPQWKFYAGGGKFSAPVSKVKPDLQKAVDGTMKFVRNFFSEVRDKDVQLRLFINSESVGAYENGKLTLNAEGAQ